MAYERRRGRILVSRRTKVGCKSGAIDHAAGGVQRNPLRADLGLSVGGFPLLLKGWNPACISVTRGESPSLYLVFDFDLLIALRFHETVQLTRYCGIEKAEVI